MIGSSINAFVDYSSLAHVLFGQQVQIKSLPTMVPCPVCRRKRLAHTKRDVPPEESHTMRVMSAPEGGQLWYCHVCAKTWDSITLLAEMHHKGDVKQAINEIIASQEFNLPRKFLTTRMIEEYLQHYVARRVAIEKWSVTARERWANHRDIYAILSEHIGIKVHSLEAMPSAANGVGRWIHSTSKSEIQEVLNLGLPPSLPRRNFNTCLAVPWNNAPGRTAALLLFGWRKSIRIWSTSSTDEGDIGVMMLDTLPPNPKRIVAVSSPYLALWLQYKFLQESNEPACIVAWHGRTDPEVWRQIDAEEVVFWDYRPSPQLFQQAMNVPGSKVSYIENPVFEVFKIDGTIESADTWEQMRRIIDVEVPANKLLNDLITRRYEPTEAIQSYLKGLEPEDISAVVEHLHLDASQINAIMDSCSGQDRAALEQMFDRTFRHKEMKIAGGVALQYIGPKSCSWTYKKGRCEEQISDAVVHLDQCVLDEDNRDRFYTGTILHQGRRYPFSATMREMMREPIKVIMETVEWGGGDSPIVSNSHASKLWDFIFKFSGAVKTYRALTRVGWDKDGQSFMFPNFIIRSGSLLPKKSLGASRDVLPGIRVDIPEPLDAAQMEQLLEPTEANGALWAVTAAMLSNLIDTINSKVTRGVGLVGDLAICAGEKMASDLGLLTFNAEQITRQIDEFRKAQRDHDLPVFAGDAGGKKFVPAAINDWIVAPDPKNVLMAMTPTHATSALLCGDWLVVDTGTDIGEYYSHGEVGIILVHFLAHYQQKLGKLPAKRKLVFAVLAELQLWAASIGQQDSTYVFKYAADAIRDPGKESAAARFVHLLAQLVHNGYLKQAYGQMLPDNSTVAVMIDTESKRVYVSKQKVVAAMKRRKLPNLDVATVTDSLRLEGALQGQFGALLDNWSIDMAFWERHVSTWIKMQEVL